jgi:hypothetical protein
MTKASYPPYPDSNWDYAVRETARMKLEKPNRHICLYCHGQAKNEILIKHNDDCPHALALETKLADTRRVAQREANELCERFTIFLTEGEYQFIPADDCDISEENFVEFVTPEVENE